jgi:DNA modification methylase
VTDLDAIIAAGGPWKRAVRIGGQLLIEGDCREVMAVLPKVDAVVTDPPYGIDYGRAGGFSASHGWGKWREQVEWDRERPSPEIFAAILSQSKEQIIWGGNYFADLLPPSMRWLAWDKGQRDFSLADMELAWTSQQAAVRVFTYARGKAVADGKQHPTQKPVALMEWCLGFLPDARTILDPFAGSGTVAVACQRLGRQSISIELDPGYWEIMCKRVDAEARAPRLDLPKPNLKPTQESFL